MSPIWCNHCGAHLSSENGLECPNCDDEDGDDDGEPKLVATDGGETISGPNENPHWVPLDDEERELDVIVDNYHDPPMVAFFDPADSEARVRCEQSLTVDIMEEQ